ncbi:MAG TPA: TetR/AcrR family transcriptional regulator [Allosphingosinicella sp.]|nr:TetR/AcrR family transcriptional regulator [Allosphingosinicella sp.]
MRRTSLKSPRTDGAASGQDPPETRRKILVAATPLFSKNGAQRTTIRQIAEAAGVNSQLIYYYFGDKDGLFRAVLDDAAGRVGALLKEAAQGNGSRRERLSRFVAEWVRVTLEEASAIRMLHRAVLDGDEALTVDVQRHSASHADEIGSLIAEGIANGDFRSEIDPRRAVASLVGMVQYLALVEPIVFASTNLKQNRKEREAMAKHTADLFLQGLDAEK